MNGVKTLNSIKSDEITSRDWFLALLTEFGASCSSMPADYESITYSDDYEYFDPEKVTSPKDLSSHWKAVYDFHYANRDCYQLKFRYAHIPKDIMPEYPRVPCKGLFVIQNNDVKPDELTGGHLIHIGVNEIEVN